MLRTADEEAFRTVSSIPGTLARLSYLASLQEQPGVYRHWGLAREYGDEAVSAAFRHSHRLVLDNLLQTDFSELAGELKMHAEDVGVPAGKCLDQMLGSPFINPFESAQHVETHISYVFAALRALARRTD